MHSWNHGEILGVSYLGKKFKAEKGERGIESNIIEEYTPLLWVGKRSQFAIRLNLFISERLRRMQSAYLPTFINKMSIKI